MAPPQLSADEVDDLVYFSRTGDNDEITTLLNQLAEREKTSPVGIITAAKDEGRSTCLHMAAANGHLETVELLLSHFTNQPAASKQAFLDSPNEYGNTGLHWAALNGHLAVVRCLVEAGASVALANDKNYVPLDLASFNEKFDVVDYFLKQSGDLERKNEEDGLSGAVADVKMEDEEEEQEGEKDGEGASSATKGASANSS